MEVQVSGLPGIRDCFAALPIDMIDAIQGRNKTQTFKAVFELRLANSAGNQGPWFLAWAGAASSSSSIEISKLLADSMGLPCGALFRVRALRDISHAETVELEPATEDDWEVLELNAAFVEDHILSQVGVLCSGQKFPIWVEGGNVLVLHVFATKPKNVVQLVPGSELVVAPKLRNVSSPGSKLVSSKESATVKAVLRVQELHQSLMQPWGDGCHLVAPTTAIFISEQTSKAYFFENGQLVLVAPPTVSSLQQTEDLEKDKARSPKVKSVSLNQANTVVLSIVFCDLVAKGHAMLASSLCHFIGAPNHSRLEVKSYFQSSGQLTFSGSIAPIKFKCSENSLSDSSERMHPNPAVPLVAGSKPSEWQKHKGFLEATSRTAQKQEGKEGSPSHDSAEGAEVFFKLWAAAQAKTISKLSQQHCSSIPLMMDTVFQFSLKQELKMSQNSSDRDPVGLFYKRYSETLVFLLSLREEKNPGERNENSSEESRSSLPAPSRGCFILDVMGLQAADVSTNSKAISGLRIQKFGHPCYVTTSIKMNGLESRRGLTLSSLSWLREPASLALQRLQVCLSPQLQAKWCKLGFPFPGFVLLHGPPACGKTKLALALANELEKNSSILCHSVVVKCAELAGEQAQAVRSVIQEVVFEAMKYAPSLIILDDLDSAIPANVSSDSAEPSTSSIVLAEYLSDLLDRFRVKRRHRIDRCVSFLAVAKEVSSLPASLCSSGRFDLHIALSAPASTQRAAILSQELDNRGLLCPENVVSEIALRCDGYDTADLEVLVDRTVNAAAPRLLLLCGGLKTLKNKKQSEQDPQRLRFELKKEDFEQGLDGFAPVCMRDLAKPNNRVGPLTWKDVGGLNDTCRALQEMLELPVKYSKIFSKAPLRLRTGVLLYGPPGCGKTHVVGIAAAACSLRLVSVKGPEILNKYIGASEQGVRDLFAKASAAAPCILFFDEFDAIAPKRGHDNTGVTDRVVNQLLTELDGVEALNGVFVFAATSRPDLLDSALLRPGRLDRLLLCDFPTVSERLEILQVLSGKLPLAEDVRLEVVASMTDAFSGADLQAVLSDAQLEAVHSFLSDETIKKGSSVNEQKRPVITMAALTSVLLKARPSVSDQERRKLYSIYDSFISSRSSMVDKVRDVKGKRATLA